MVAEGGPDENFQFSCEMSTRWGQSREGCSVLLALNTGIALKNHAVYAGISNTIIVLLLYYYIILLLLYILLYCISDCNSVVVCRYW